MHNASYAQHMARWSRLSSGVQNFEAELPHLVRTQHQELQQASRLDLTALPCQTLKAPHLVNGLFQPAKPFSRGHPQTEPQVMAAGPLEVPLVLFRMIIHAGTFTPESMTTTATAPQSATPPPFH
jgi:hypothetical protein